MESFEFLYDHFKIISAIPRTEFEEFLRIAKPRREKYTKGQIYCKMGDPPTQLGIVTDGIFRVSVITGNGGVYHKKFLTPGNFIAAFSSILTGQPNNVEIVAVTDAALIELTAEVRSLFDMHPCWQEFGRKVSEALYVEREDKELSQLTENAEQRYARFLQRYSEFKDRIPLQDVAAYLGISPVSLSRIRGKK